MVEISVESDREVTEKERRIIKEIHDVLEPLLPGLATLHADLYTADFSLDAILIKFERGPDNRVMVEVELNINHLDDMPDPAAGKFDA